MAEGIIIGMCLAYVVFRAHEVAEGQRIRRQAARIKSPGETICSYNATVMRDGWGRLSWVDNDRNVKVYEAEQ